jgi:hypothetical protein
VQSVDSRGSGLDMNRHTDSGDGGGNDPVGTAPPTGESGRPDAAQPVLDAPRADASASGAPAHLRAHLLSALTRAFAGTTARRSRGALGSDFPGPTAGEEAAAYDEALRHAFLTAIPVVPAGPASRGAAHRETRLDALVSHPELRLLESERLLAAAGLEATVPHDEPPTLPPERGPSADLPTGPATRSSGSTAANDLLEVHGSVKIAADDFFGGLVRRVERRP